jgi:hypothetical protein
MVSAEFVCFGRFGKKKAGVGVRLFREKNAQAQDKMPVFLCYVRFHIRFPGKNAKAQEEIWLVSFEKPWGKNAKVQDKMPVFFCASSRRFLLKMTELSRNQETILSSSSSPPYQTETVAVLR